LPKRVLFAEQLPRNGRGKVQKNLLRAAYPRAILRTCPPYARP